MATEQILPFNVASVVEDVLQQHGGRLSDVNLASRKAEEACIYPPSPLFSQFHSFNPLFFCSSFRLFFLLSEYHYDQSKFL